MTRDEIIKLAREAGFDVNFDIWAVSVDGVHINKELHRFAALVAAAEREACAKVCDPEPSLPNEAYTVLNNKATMRRCAAAIRARGQE